MVRVFFPSMFMRLISWKPSKTPPQALLHVPPAMTKHEITEYLTKIYDVNVSKVMTANFLGKTVAHKIFERRDVFDSEHATNRCRQVEAIVREEEGDFL